MVGSTLLLALTLTHSTLVTAGAIPDMVEVGLAAATTICVVIVVINSMVVTNIVIMSTIHLGAIVGPGTVRTPTAAVWDACKCMFVTLETVKTIFTVRIFVTVTYRNIKQGPRGKLHRIYIV